MKKMNITFSLKQIPKTGDLNTDLIKSQYKLDKMAKFMEIKSINPKLKQSEMAKEMKMPSFTLQQYRREINMLTPYRISNTYARKQKPSDHDYKMTSNDLKMTSKDPIENDKPVSKKVKSKNNLKGGDPNDNTGNRGDSVEQAFSSQWNFCRN